MRRKGQPRPVRRAGVRAFGSRWHHQTVATHHVPKPGERPDVEVLVDETWCAGELRMWTQDDDGSWTAQGSTSHRAPTPA